MPDTLPKLAKLPLSGGALKKHRALHPGSFEKVIKKGDAQYRYYSDTLSLCRGEYLLSQLPSRPGDWVMFIALNDREMPTQDKWYGLHAKDNGVILEHIASFDTLLTLFDYPLIQSEVIYLHSQDIPERLSTQFGDKIERTDITLSAVPPQYGLKPLKQFGLKHGLVVGGLSLCALGAMLALSHEPPPPPPVNPWDAWTERYLSQSKADPGLVKAAQLVSLGWSLPIDWQPGNVTQSGNQLNLTITPRRGAKLATLNAWSATLPGWAQIAGDTQSSQVSVPLSAPNEAQLFALGDYHQRLHDELILLGANNLVMSHTPSTYNTHEWQYRLELKATNITTLTTLSQLLQTKPVFVSELHITALTPPLLDAAMTLTLMGQ